MKNDLPLNPGLSPSEGERENCNQSSRKLSVAGKSADESIVAGILSRRALLFPLPIRWGEGQGEGPHV